MGVSVRHNSRLAALVALAAAVITVAWFSRALQTNAWTDWAWCLVVASVGVLQLLVVRDGRAPLMVADEHGVRVRRGETWSGLRWQDIEHVEVQSPGSWLRDGQIVVHPHALSDTVEAYVVPLARTTKLEFEGLTGDLVPDLDSLASGRVPVLVLTRIENEAPEKPEKAEKAPKPEKAAKAAKAPKPEKPAKVAKVAKVEKAPKPAKAPKAAKEKAPRPANAVSLRDRWSALLVRLAQVRSTPREGTEPVALEEQVGEPTTVDEAEPTPLEPVRQPLPAARVEVVLDSVRMLADPPAIPAQRTAEHPVVVARVDEFSPAPRATPAAPRPVENAVIGPVIAAARHRARLSIDGLSERTRIRPHVLECIEIDDFEACGGDFYARGHLRTLARIFGLDPQQLLDLYDENYAQPEIEAKQVFEADLATGIGGGVRSTYSGPRWSLLAASVLALASIWGMARIFNDTPQELVSPAPNVVDSAGLAQADTEAAPKLTLATLEVAADGNSPQVVVRDRDGRILWAGKLADGQSQQVIGQAPFDVTASVGESVKVSFLGKAKGAVGDSEAAASKQFG